MKKVLIFPEFDKFGGTRTYFKNLIDFYFSEGYEIVIALEKNLCDDEISEFLQSKKIKINILQKNFQTGYLSRFPISIIYDLIVGIPVIHREKPDIVIITVGSPGKYLGLMARSPINVVYILHSYPRRILSRHFYRWFFSISLTYTKRILTVSRFSRNEIIKWWLTEKKEKYVEYIYNFSDFECHPYPLKDTVKKNVRTILTLGHVRTYKNPDIWYTVAVKTIEQYSGDVEFLWAGDGDLFDFFRDKARVEKIPQIQFLGFQKNVSDLYNRCDIYYQPSRMESQGLAVLDAMQLSLPCVVSNVGGLPESVIDGKTGYVIDPENVDEMVKKILGLLENDDLRKSMGDAAKEYYEKIFSYGRWKREMEKLNENWSFVE